jgi:hypothetical protein
MKVRVIECADVDGGRPRRARSAAALGVLHCVVTRAVVHAPPPATHACPSPQSPRHSHRGQLQQHQRPRQQQSPRSRCG